MTRTQIIGELNAMRKNNFTKTQKEQWLNEVEERLNYLHALNPKGESKTKKSKDELNIPFAFNKIYLLYCLAQMELFGGNPLGHNLYVQAFNAEVQSYQAFCLKQKDDL